MINQAVILAGGLGTRLGVLTRNVPKPLLNVSHRPFIEYLFWNLRRHGIFRVVLSIGYLADRFEALLGNGSQFGLELNYLTEKDPLGTGGALKFGMDLLDDIFLVLNGDTLFDINYLDLAQKLSRENVAAIALRRVDNVSPYGQVHLNKGKIKDFCEKAHKGKGLVSGGVYAMTKKVFDYLPNGCSSIERSLFPQLAEMGRLFGKIYNGFFLDIGLPETYTSAQILLPKWKNGLLFPSFETK